MLVVFFGPPGCGKGTQSEYLIKNNNFVHLSTGNLLRAEIEAGSEIGLQLKETIGSGKLVSDDIVVALVKKNIALDGQKSILFDGFPRTLNQAYLLDEMLAEIGKSLGAVIDFQINHEKLIDRVSGRFSCSTCGAVYHERNRPTIHPGVCDHCGATEFEHRADDNPEALAKRLISFDEMTKPLREYYKQKGILVTVNGDQDVDTVKMEIKQALGL